MPRSKALWLAGPALLAAGCVDSGNRGWDLGRWHPPLVGEPQVEAYRGVHEGRIGVACVRGGEPTVFIETWRALSPEGPPKPTTLTYRIDGVERSAPGMLGRSRFAFPGDATPVLIEQLAQGARLEALLPIHGGGVYPVTFEIGNFATAHRWVRDECAQL